MISPFKAVIGNDYKVIEAKLLTAIHLRFGLKNPSPPGLLKRIKQADKVSAALEAVHLAGFAPVEALKIFGPAPRLHSFNQWLAPMTSEAVQAGFLARFDALEQAMKASSNPAPEI